MKRRDLKWKITVQTDAAEAKMKLQKRHSTSDFPKKLEEIHVFDSPHLVTSP